MEREFAIGLRQHLLRERPQNDGRRIRSTEHNAAKPASSIQNHGCCGVGKLADLPAELQVRPDRTGRKGLYFDPTIISSSVRIVVNGARSKDATGTVRDPAAPRTTAAASSAVKANIQSAADPHARGCRRSCRDS